MFALWRTATICYIEVLRPETIMLRLHMIHHRHSRQDFHCWDGGLLPASQGPLDQTRKKRKKSQQPYRSHHFSLTKVYYAGGGELYIHNIHIS